MQFYVLWLKPNQSSFMFNLSNAVLCSVIKPNQSNAVLCSVTKTQPIQRNFMFCN